MTVSPAEVVVSPAQVVAFWLEAGPDKWFTKDAAFDAAIRARFLPVYEAAVRGELADWEQTAEGALALVIVLDQFPRNMFRGEARIYAADPLAREIAGRAIARGFDEQVTLPGRKFFYLPFEHSEDAADQARSVELNRMRGDADSLKWAEHHADIVRRFGRFPHRNGILGRVSTGDEEAFLAAGGFTG